MGKIASQWKRAELLWVCYLTVLFTSIISGVLRGIGQLNQAEIVLKEIHHRHGLLGIRRCFSHAVDEWVDDIVNNLPHVIASCGPISPLVQISKGFMDLFWMPVAEMRKEDGHVVKGIQKGVGSFGLSSAAGIVGIAQSAVGVLQVCTLIFRYYIIPFSQLLKPFFTKYSQILLTSTEETGGLPEEPERQLIFAMEFS